MAVWRPPPEIKVKVIGLVWRGDEMLLVEVEDDHRRVKGLRPLGGSVEFGETREAALQREFAEELGCGVAVTSLWHGFENIYVHEGELGHEFVFAANVQLDDRQLYRQDTIEFTEANLTACKAGWFTPTHLPEGVDLYPTGLLVEIEASTVSPDGYA